MATRVADEWLLSTEPGLQVGSRAFPQLTSIVAPLRGTRCVLAARWAVVDRCARARGAACFATTGSIGIVFFDEKHQCIKIID